MKRTIALAALPLLALTACGGSSTSTVTKTVTQTVTASPTAGANSPGETPAAGDDGAVDPASEDATASSSEETTETGEEGPLAFGDTYTSGTSGRKMTLSELSPYNPSESAALDEDAPAGSVYRKFKITLDNSSKETFDAGDISLSATAGERTVSTIVDGEVGDTPYVKVLPGRKLSWTVAYAVKPGEHLTVEVSTLGGTVATWDTTVK